MYRSFARSARLALGLACLLALPPGARAQEALLASDDYAAIIHDAVAEIEDQHFPEARALFTRAHELRPSARTFRGIGISAFEMRDYIDATLNLEQALASQERPLTGKLRSEGMALLERSYGFVGRFQLSIAPADALLVIDDVETTLRDGERLLLPIGQHTVLAKTATGQSEKRAIAVTGGESSGLLLTVPPPPPPVLVPTPVEVAQASVVTAPVIAEPERPTAQPLYKKPWVWIASGVVVVATVAVVAATAGGDKVTRERDARDPLPPGVTLSGLVSQ